MFLILEQTFYSLVNTGSHFALYLCRNCITVICYNGSYISYYAVRFSCFSVFSEL